MTSTRVGRQARIVELVTNRAVHSQTKRKADGTVVNQHTYEYT